MNSSEYSAILLCKNKPMYADKLRACLREVKCELVYTTTLNDIVDFLNNKNSGLIFIDKYYRSYFNFVNMLAKDSGFLKPFNFIFLDKELDYYKSFEVNKNISVLQCDNNLLFGLKNLINFIAKYNVAKLNIDFNELNLELTKYLMFLGFSQKYIGFNYIKDVVITIIKNNFKFCSLQKNVYPIIAMKHNTQVFNIERNIRSALKGAFHYGTILYAKFGNATSSITNRSFLNYIVDYTIDRITSAKPLININ